jgi:hypothetical protein
MGEALQAPQPGASLLDNSMPKPAREIIIKARTSWLKNTEVVDVLNNYRSFQYKLSKDAPNAPQGE